MAIVLPSSVNVLLAPHGRINPRPAAPNYPRDDVAPAPSFTGTSRNAGAVFGEGNPRRLVSAWKLRVWRGKLAAQDGFESLPGAVESRCVGGKGPGIVAALWRIGYGIFAVIRRSGVLRENPGSVNGFFWGGLK